MPRPHGVNDFAAKAMRAAKMETSKPVDAMSMKKLDSLLAEYDTKHLNSPLQDKQTLQQQQPHTPTPTPAAMKIIEETRIEMEKQKRSIAKLTAQLQPNTPVGLRQDDIDLEDLERRLAEMEAADEQSHKNSTRRHKISHAYGCVDTQPQESRANTKAIKKRLRTYGCVDTQPQESRANTKAIKKRLRTKGRTALGRAGPGKSKTRSAKVYNNRINQSSNHHHHNATTTTTMNTNVEMPTKSTPTKERAQRVAKARNNAVSLANRRKNRVMKEEAKFLKEQSQLLEAHQKELKSLESSDRHGYPRNIEDDLMSSRHVLDIASENSYPIDQLRNDNKSGGGGGGNDEVAGTLWAREVKPAPSLLKKTRTKKTIKTRTMKKKTSKYAISVQMNKSPSGLSVRELKEKVRLHQEKMTTLRR